MKDEIETRCEIYRQALERLLLSFPSEIHEGEPIPEWKAKYFIAAREDAARIIHGKIG